MTHRPAESVTDKETSTSALPVTDAKPIGHRDSHQLDSAWIFRSTKDVTAMGVVVIAPVFQKFFLGSFVHDL
jgi:hypothetical protein